MAGNIRRKQIKSVEMKVWGKIDFHVFSGQQGHAAYSVSYSDYPEAFGKKGDPEKMLDGGRSGAVSSVNGKLICETKITFEGNPGRELLIDIMSKNGQEGTVKVRFFIGQKSSISGYVDCVKR